MSLSKEMEEFRNTFFTECEELLSDMEEKLNEIENGEYSDDHLHAIFRCVHSIKGGAGAFDLQEIAAFTHEFEFFLDRLREHENVSVTAEQSELLFSGRDALEHMIACARNNAAVPEGYGKEILTRITCMNEQAGKQSPSGMSAETEMSSQKLSEAITYRISFKPHTDLLKTGSEPILLLRELSRLGRAQISCSSNKIPELEHLDPAKCYLSWDITLTTSEPEEEIREVFAFVEDECELEISRVDSEDASAGSGETQPPIARSAGESTLRKTVESIRVDTEKIDRLVNMVGELVIAQGMLESKIRNIQDRYPELLLDMEELAQHTRELQESVMAVRMQPVKSLFARMPRTVRDLAKKLDKKARLEMNGEATEVDKTIIEQLADPLTHMIRNSVDHGLEMPEERIAQGKEETGTVWLSAHNSGGRIEIAVKDDGAGINRERVKSKAIEKGIVDSGASLSDEEIDQLIFAPGFSTAAQVSDVSGRGVGMDVVKRNIEAIGGYVRVQNTPGEGSAFIISLPLTLAVMDGMAVLAGKEQYIIPIGNILETLRPEPHQVQKVVNNSQVLNIRGELIPLLHLGRIFQIANAEENASNALVVIVYTGREKYGLIIDELVGQQQVVIKSLEANTKHVNGIAGATILGDGNVSLILDMSELFRLNASLSPVQSINSPQNEAA